MYRVEVTEINTKYGDIDRISTPTNNTLADITSKINYYFDCYKDKIKEGKYIIKIAYYEIDAQ